MKSCIIHDLPDWRVTSYGNGLAYAIDHKPSGENMFVQGDDADIFRAEFDALTSLRGTGPNLYYADALDIIFSEYKGI